MFRRNYDTMYSPSQSLHYNGYMDEQWNSWHVHFGPDYSRAPPPIHYFGSSDGQRYNAQNNLKYFRKRFYHGNTYDNNWENGSGAYRKTWSESRDDFDIKSKSKRKKTLSKSLPQKNNWTFGDAEKVLTVERESTKGSKNLIIRFPDHELNKDAVFKFHPAIENVHFQQPSTARFCFVSLQESAKAEEVINTLNKQTFGRGFLSVEYKKDRQKVQDLLDIDPLTLFVGNLAPEVTQDDLIRLYPKYKSVNIGFAKKMKYTRYAFVRFGNVTESVEAYKRTCSIEMYSKGLIVRFRRINGTVGMPGESKPQNPPKHVNYTNNESFIVNERRVIEEDAPENIITTNVDELNVQPNTNKNIKEQKCVVDSDNVAPFFPESIETTLACHKPKLLKWQSKTEIESNVVKIAKQQTKTQYRHNDKSVNKERLDKTVNLAVKAEPNSDEDEFDYSANFQKCAYEDNSEDDDTDIFNGLTNLNGLYEKISSYREKINELKNSVDTL